jgi:vacuolar-type H+-ATPase subunit E/Vma4
MTQMIGNLDDLANGVQKRADVQAADRVDRARQQATKIVDDAKARAADITRQTVADARRQADEFRRQRLAEARAKTRQQSLQAREEILHDAWEGAEKRLRDLVGGGDYPEILRQLAWLGVRTLGPGDLVLTAEPEGHQVLSKDRLSQWSKEASDEFGSPVTFERAPKPLDTWGGLLVTAKGGKEQMNATFSFRLQEARGELRDHVFHVLTGAT